MMTHQEKQINYMGPFLTMVFLFLIVGFLDNWPHISVSGAVEGNFSYESR